MHTSEHCLNFEVVLYDLFLNFHRLHSLSIPTTRRRRRVKSFSIRKARIVFCLLVLCNGQNAFEHLLKMKLTSAQTAKTTTITTTFYWYNANLLYKNLVNAAQHKNKPQRNSYFYAHIKNIDMYICKCLCDSVCLFVCVKKCRQSAAETATTTISELTSVIGLCFILFRFFSLPLRHPITSL